MHPLKPVRRTLSVDGVTASVDVPVQTLTDTLASILGAAVYPCRPLRGMGYSHAAELVHPDTLARRCVVQYGDAHSKPNVLAEGTHEYDAPALYDALCLHFAGQWSPSRLDVALDFHDSPESFDTLARMLLDFAASRGITIDQRGDWERGKARTLYLYSRESRFYVRLYEYRAKHGHGPDCRLELETKLKRQEERLTLTTRAPLEILAMCPATFEVVQALDLLDERIPVTPGPRAPSSVERDKAFLAATAAPALLRLAAHHHGDLMAAVLDVLAYRDETARTRRLTRERPTVTIQAICNPE